MSATIWGIVMGVIAVMAGIIRWQTYRRDKELAAKIGRKLATQEAMNNAEITGDDPAAAKRWLRDRDANR